MAAHNLPHARNGQQKEQLLLQLSPRGQWHNTQFWYFAHGHTGYLRFDVAGGAITVYGHVNDLSERLQEAVNYFNGIACPARDVLNITPEEVIEYFYSSPNLASIAPDVEAVLSPMVRGSAGALGGSAGTLAGDMRAVRGKLDVSSLFDSSGRAVRGAQSRIAEVLGISTGGAHRKRILAVLGVLQRENNSTTTLKSFQNSNSTQKIAV